MKKPPHVIEIFLQPGECYFGGRDTRIRTLLGSCVAITLWHPQLLLGGICHYMLPARSGKGPAGLDGKYADEALEFLFREIRQAGASAAECHAKLFGGGNMFHQCGRLSDYHIGKKNVEAGRSLLKRHGLAVSAEHLGGSGHRNVLFDVWSGNVWVRHQPLAHSPCDHCEMENICRAA